MNEPKEIKTTPAAQWRLDGETDPFAGQHYDQDRAALCKGDLTDDQMANQVFLNPGIANLTGAKERIRWLSRALQNEIDKNKSLALNDFQKSVLCKDEKCELTGNVVGLSDASVVAEVTAELEQVKNAFLLKCPGFKEHAKKGKFKIFAVLEL